MPLFFSQVGEELGDTLYLPIGEELSLWSFCSFFQNVDGPYRIPMSHGSTPAGKDSFGLLPKYPKGRASPGCIAFIDQIYKNPM